MNKIWKVIVPAAVFAFCACSDGGTPVTGDEVPALKALDTRFKKFISTYDIPGAALAVSRQGRLVYARGFGFADKSTGAKVQPDTVFRIASVSKTITGMAVGKLIEDGKVSLQDKVFGPGGILSEYEYTPPADLSEPSMLDIRVWHLLTHTSGLPGEGAGDPQYDYVNIAAAMKTAAPPDAPTVLQYVLKNVKLKFVPGTQKLYSNVGFNALGRIVEKKTGVTYESYVRSLLATVGVSGMYIAGDMEADRRTGETFYYDEPFCMDAKYDGSGTRVPCSYGTLHFTELDSHGGWIASPIDLLKFAAGVDGFGHRKSLLSADTIKALSQVPPSPSGAMAYNSWGQDAQGNWSHSGALTTGTAALIYRGADETEWAAVFNRLPVKEGGGMTDIELFFNELADLSTTLKAVGSWPATDLFDRY